MGYKLLAWSLWSAAVLLTTLAEKFSDPAVNPLEKKLLSHGKSDLIYRTSIVDASYRNTNTRCGGVLTEAVDIFSYGNETQLEPNERCVWIIRVQNATRYMVNVKEMGFESDPYGTQIILTGIGWDNLDRADHFVPTRGNPFHIFNDRNVIMITFHTGNSVGNSVGFTLEYSALPNPESDVRPASPLSVDFFDTTSFQPSSIRHPASGTYDNNEISVFVLAPRNNTFQRGQRSQVLYTRVELESSTCADSLQIQKFNSSSLATSKWENAGVICGDIANARINSADLVVIVFRSDFSRVYAGFHLMYEAGCDVDDDSTLI